MSQVRIMGKKRNIQKFFHMVRHIAGNITADEFSRICWDLSQSPCQKTIYIKESLDIPLQISLKG